MSSAFEASQTIALLEQVQSREPNFENRPPLPSGIRPLGKAPEIVGRLVAHSEELKRELYESVLTPTERREINNKRGALSHLIQLELGAAFPHACESLAVCCGGFVVTKQSLPVALRR